MFDAIGDIADDTQSPTVEALGSCSDRAKITLNGCDTSDPSGHVHLYQYMITMHVPLGKISGGVCGDDRFSVQSCHKTVPIASAQSSIGLAMSIMTEQHYVWLGLACQPILRPTLLF